MQVRSLGIHPFPPISLHEDNIDCLILQILTPVWQKIIYTLLPKRGTRHQCRVPLPKRFPKTLGGEGFRQVGLIGFSLARASYLKFGSSQY